jgi:hypothetical protein
MTTQHNQKQREEKEPVPDARHEQSLRRTDAVKAAIKVRLVEFDHHKEALLTILRDAHSHGPKSEPFDADKSWSHLTGLASVCYWQARVKQETMPVADREARLRELAKALGKARDMTDKAMQDDVGDDLLSAWWEETNEPRASVARNDDGSFALVRIADEMFKEAVAGLAALETAALRAASEAHEQRAGHSGPKRGTMLLDYIGTLAFLYRDSTGAKPGTGRGPFVRFVCAFLAAIRANISEEYAVELAQNARSWARTNSSKWTSSPFGDSFVDDSPFDD